MTTGWKIEQDALAAVGSRKSLWLLQAAGNALILTLGYAWLWIPEASGWQLALSALAALLCLLAFLWLQSGTFAFFQAVHGGGRTGLRDAFASGLKRLPAFLLCALVFWLVLWCLLWLLHRGPVLSARIASALTLWVQKPVSPAVVHKSLRTVLLLVAMIPVPVVLLPVAASVVRSGYSGFGGGRLAAALRISLSLRLWIDYAGLLLMGAVIPYFLIWWIPKMASLNSQALSMVVRFLAAYLLGVTAWVVLVSLVGRMTAEQR